MSNPILIDSLGFSQAHSTLSGTRLLAEMPRLAAELADTTGGVEWRLVGSLDKYKRPILQLNVSGALRLQCQRCLQPLTLALKAHSRMVQFTNETRLEQAVAEDDSLDAILTDPELDVLALIEDEILLSLPLAARHEVCESDPLSGLAATKPNPFAVLANLKRQPS
jgi:uncharacterized protein